MTAGPITATGFSHDFSLGGGRAADGELFAVSPLTEFHLGGETMLARNALTGRSMALAAEVVNALSYCTTFRTLDEHVAELMAGSDGTPERARAIRSILQSVRDGGLTLSAADLCRDLAPAAGADLRTAPEAPVVAIVTCDRSAALQRLLQSLPQGCDLGSVHRLLIVDDSRAAEHRQRNQELARQAGRQSPCPLDYFGANEARQFIDSLLRQLPRYEQEIRFLADRERWSAFISTGVTRNLAQLLAVGRPLIVFDDDAVCNVYAPGFVREGLEFSAGRRQASFFDTVDSQEGHRVSDADPVQRLNRCLGLTLPDALTAIGAPRLQQQALRPAESRFAARLSRQSRIKVTECGTIGDPGTQDYAWLGAVPEETARRIAGNARQAELALRNAPCWLGVDRLTFAPNANFSQLTGFDNREFLPPYFPFERGQDRVFGETLSFLFPGDVVLVHPWAVLHQRVAGLERAQDLQRRWNPGGFPGLLTFEPLERAAACHAVDLPARLASLSASFNDLGHSARDTLSRLRAEQRLRESSLYLERLRNTLELSNGAVPAWTDWLQQQLKQAREGMASAEETPANSDEILGLWQGAWRAFGRALEAWPAIRAAAAELRHQARGQRVQ
jgi:hypothetical protein